MRPFSLSAAGHRLEAVWHGEPTETNIVLLHEGLGSVSAWRDFPAELAEASGLGVLVYSRWGYGRSDPVVLPRPLRYMHHEALEALPDVLDAAQIERAVLVGHSDGASIAIIHAGSPCAAGRVRGLVLCAPHVFCEDISVASIRSARDAFESDDLRSRLARHHADVDGAFWGWNRAWLDPDFRAWDIQQYLAGIDVPVTAIQGRDDPYGTIDQVDAIESQVAGPFRRLILDDVGHAPHRNAPEQTRSAIVALVRDLDR